MNCFERYRKNCDQGRQCPVHRHDTNFLTDEELTDALNPSTPATTADYVAISIVAILASLVVAICW